MKNYFLKLLFGFIIFLFSLGLAYSTASYAASTGAQPFGEDFNYWIVLACFGVAYVAIGIIIRNVYPVSLGFLLSADIIILHILFDKYHSIPDAVKLTILLCILTVLYVIAWEFIKDEKTSDFELKEIQNSSGAINTF